MMVASSASHHITSQHAFIPTLHDAHGMLTYAIEFLETMTTELEHGNTHVCMTLSAC